MSGFRPGDRIVMIDGVETRLRLTLSALAEIAALTNTGTPAALAHRLRQAGRETGSGVWQPILKAIATPRPAGDISPSDMGRILPDLTAVIVEGLGG